MTNYSSELQEVVTLTSRYLKDAVRNQGSKLHQLQNDLYYEFGYRFNDACNEFYLYYATDQNRSGTPLHDKWDRSKCELSTYVYACIYNFLRARRKQFIRERDQPTDLLDYADVELTEEVEELEYSGGGIMDYDVYHQVDPEEAYIIKTEYEDLVGNFTEAELSVLRGEKSLSEASDDYSIKYKTLQKSINRKVNFLKNNCLHLSDLCY